MAQTLIPLEFTPDYRVRHKQWAEQRDKGQSAPMPSFKGFSVNHADKPTTVDLCTWLMDLVAGGDVFSTLTDHAIAQAQNAAFVNNLNAGGGTVIKSIDALSGESVSGLLLHEVSHHRHMKRLEENADRISSLPTPLLGAKLKTCSTRMVAMVGTVLGP